MEDQCLYRVLNVPKTASRKEIKAAYYHLCDKYKVVETKSEIEHFKKLTFAYKILSNPNKRALYDTHGLEGVEELETEHKIKVKKLFLKSSIVKSLRIFYFLLMTTLFFTPLLVNREEYLYIYGASAIPLWILFTVIIIISMHIVKSSRRIGLPINRKGKFILTIYVIKIMLIFIQCNIVLLLNNSRLVWKIVPYVSYEVCNLMQIAASFYDQRKELIYNTNKLDFASSFPMIVRLTTVLVLLFCSKNVYAVAAYFYALPILLGAALYVHMIRLSKHTKMVLFVVLLKAGMIFSIFYYPYTWMCLSLKNDDVSIVCQTLFIADYVLATVIGLYIYDYGIITMESSLKYYEAQKV